jgi:hypothetical protein
MTTNEAKGTKDRRSLVEGLSATVTVDPSLEKQFVFAQKTSSTEPVTPAKSTGEASLAKGTHAPSVSRVPFTTRLRTDYAEALKRASLERQLSKTVPNTLQDILEEALEPWLQANGYLTSPRQ